MAHHVLTSVRSCPHRVVALAGVVAGLSVAVPTSLAAVPTSAGGPYTGAEGQHVAIHGTASGAGGYTWSAARAPGGEQDRARCTFADATALSTRVWCNDDGTFQLTLTGSNGSTSTARLTLSNVRPVLTRMRVRPRTAARHAVVRVVARYRDPGPIDRHKYVIRWGDHSSSRASTRERLNGTGAFSGSHSYARPGRHKVRVVVFDSHGARDRASRWVRVVRHRGQ